MSMLKDGKHTLASKCTTVTTESYSSMFSVKYKEKQLNIPSKLKLKLKLTKKQKPYFSAD